jgi:hypothetical protein
LTQFGVLHGRHPKIVIGTGASGKPRKKRKRKKEERCRGDKVAFH